jgi:hypothetical protein
VWIQATIEHLSPDSPRSRTGTRSRLSVRLYVPWSCFLGTRQATTATGRIRSKSSRHDEMLVSALAYAVPESIPFSSDGVRVQHGQPAKCESGKIAAFGRHYRFVSIWASTIRLTNSAMEIPRRFASRLRYCLCGSVNEIICLVMRRLLHSASIPQGIR